MRRTASISGGWTGSRGPTTVRSRERTISKPDWTASGRCGCSIICIFLRPNATADAASSSPAMRATAASATRSVFPGTRISPGIPWHFSRTLRPPRPMSGTAGGAMTSGDTWAASVTTNSRCAGFSSVSFHRCSACIPLTAPSSGESRGNMIPARKMSFRISCACATGCSRISIP